MSTLSVFIDESGDFGSFDPKCPFYIFSLVFHNQDNNVKDLSDKFKSDLLSIGFKKAYFHAGPILRKEKDYKYYPKQIRVKSFNRMTKFIRDLPIKYTTIEVNKKETNGGLDLGLALARKLRLFINDNLEYFQSYDKVKVYYDNGQENLSKVLKVVFEFYFNSIVEKFDADPRYYTLFQVADAITTFRLVYLKYNNKTSSRSEIEFFGENSKFFKKNYVDKIISKRL